MWGHDYSSFLEQQTLWVRACMTSPILSAFEDILYGFDADSKQIPTASTYPQPLHMGISASNGVLVPGDRWRDFSFSLWRRNSCRVFTQNQRGQTPLLWWQAISSSSPFLVAACSSSLSFDSRHLGPPLLSSSLPSWESEDWQHNSKHFQKHEKKSKNKISKNK